ncbi:MAG: OsmC family protein [Gemmatimonadaceae bacterium]|nr:OsmC family protein [Gemmatimonadaceae bacterium]
MTAATRPPQRVHVSWRGAHRFAAASPGHPEILMDGDREQGPSPVDTLLAALAGCTGYDVVEILGKRRATLSSVSVDVDGTRVDAIPARVVAIHLGYTIVAEGIAREHAERAVELAVTKYCSVRESLAKDIAMTWSVTLNGEPGETRAG